MSDNLIKTIKNKLLHLWEDNFFKSIAKLGGAAALGQAIVMVVSPILTRLYTASDFGILAVYSSIIGIFGIIVALRYDIAIPIPKRAEHAANLLVLAFMGVGIVSGIIGLIAWVWSDFFANLINSPDFAKYMWLIPIGLIGNGSYQTLKYWALRAKSYNILSRTKIIQGGASASSQVGIGFVGLGPVGLIIGNILGRSAGITSLARVIKKDFKHFKNIRFKRMISLAKHYKYFPLVSLPGALLNNAGVHVPVFFLSAIFGPNVTGWYALADRVIKAPVNILGKATQDVYIGEFSERLRTNPDSLMDLYKETTYKLFWIGIIPAVVAFLAGPYAFELIFGDGWRMAGMYVRILSPMLLFRFITSPLMHTLNILERQGTLMIWEAFRLVLIVMALLAGYFFEIDDIKTLILYSGAATISYAAVYFLNLFVLKRNY